MNNFLIFIHKNLVFSKLYHTFVLIILAKPMFRKKYAQIGEFSLYTTI